MNMSNNSSIWVEYSQIKQKISLLDILDYYHLTPTFHRKGDILRGRCPFGDSQKHGKNPNQFKINLGLGVYGSGGWTCFGDCKIGGGLLEFVARKEGIGEREAALFIKDRMFPERFNLQDTKKETASEQEKFRSEQIQQTKKKTSRSLDKAEQTNSLLKPLDFTLALDPTHSSLKERSLQPKTISYFGLGFFTGKRGLMKDRIAIPIYAPNTKEGENPVAYAGRLVGTPTEAIPRYKFPPVEQLPKGRVIYNLHKAVASIRKKPDLPIIVVEGFFALFHLYQELGLENVCALMGSSLVEEPQGCQKELLLLSHNRFLLLFDADLPGRRCTLDVSVALLSGGATEVRAINLPFLPEKYQPDHFSAKELRKILTL